MSGFIFQSTKNLLCELGSSKRVGELLLGAIGPPVKNTSVMLVTDPGILKYNLEKACITGIRSLGYNVKVYSDVSADPHEKSILDAVAIAKQDNVNAVIGLGGGSSMDVAKLVAYLADASCVQSLQDIYGVGKCTSSRLPLFQIPTTAGTGSEVTPISIVTTGANSKMGVVSPQLLPDWAILDGNCVCQLINCTYIMDAIASAQAT